MAAQKWVVLPPFSLAMIASEGSQRALIGLIRFSLNRVVFQPTLSQRTKNEQSGGCLTYPGDLNVA
jgi:hypothetical protein